MIQFLLLEALKLLVFMICSLIIGIAIPLMITILLVYTTDLTFRDCIISIPFGWTTLVMTMDGFKYLGKSIEKYNAMILAKELKEQQAKQEKKNE